MGAYDSEFAKYVGSQMHQQVLSDISDANMHHFYLEAMRLMFDKVERLGLPVIALTVCTDLGWGGTNIFKRAYCVLKSTVVHVTDAMSVKVISRSDVEEVDKGAFSTQIKVSGMKTLSVPNAGNFFGRDYRTLRDLLYEELG